MPITKIQSDVLRLLAAHRDSESNVGEATPLNRKALRLSGELALRDAATLETAGYRMQWLRQPLICTVLHPVDLAMNKVMSAANFAI